MTSLLSTALVSLWLAAPPTVVPPPSPTRPVVGPPPIGVKAGDRQITPSVPAAADKGDRKSPSCEELRRKGKYSVYFDKVDIEKLIQTVSDATCKTFILGDNVRGKISIIGPENGRVEVTGEEFYAAFLAALDANALAAYPSGRFMKIVSKREAKQNTVPTYIEPDAEYTTNEQMITKLFKLKYAEIDPIKNLLSTLATKDGDVQPVQPDMLIITDIGSNVHRLERLIEQLDTRAGSDEVRVIQVKYAIAQDVANTIQKLFESKGKPGARTAAPYVANTGNYPQTGVVPPPAAGTPQPAGENTGNGPVTLSQVIPDERTNKLIIMASPAAFERIVQLINQVDVPISGEGRINVYNLSNANAEEIAGTLQSLAQGTANKPRSTPGTSAAPAAPRPAGGVNAAELFSGEVKISADKGTNSLVIVATQSDYRNLVRVIEKLDIPRRQVFVEAVIMEINLDRETDFGISLHRLQSVNVQGNDLPIFLGTKYTKQGLPPSLDITNLLSLSGALVGIQGAPVPALTKLGINFPSFGVLLHALQTSSDVNVLSTPHLLTSDNEEAEITVGQNVPFQAGFSPTSLSGLGAGATGATGSLPLQGFGSLIAPIQRQNVDLKLTIKPTINESDYVRMVINEQTEEIASQDPVLGPTTSKRSAKTTIIARNQETVVIGGIMQDRTIETVNKIPILGDIPILGHLFREQTRHRIKTNLVLFLTPYIIREQSDFRVIFERKMRERQMFIEEFYGQVPGYDAAVDFSRKAGPVAKMNQVLLREERKAENDGPGLPGERVIQPTGRRPAQPADPTPPPLDPNPIPPPAPGASPDTVPPTTRPPPAAHP